MITKRPLARNIELLACGTPKYLGTITATAASANNVTTSVPFFNTGDGLAGKLLLIQADAVCFIATDELATVTVTRGNGCRLEQYFSGQMVMPPDEGFIAVIPESGTVNLKVFELK